VTNKKVCITNKVTNVINVTSNKSMAPIVGVRNTRTSALSFPCFLYGCTTLVDLGHIFNLLILYTVGRTP
jgi:hypothetical protein